MVPLLEYDALLQKMRKMNEDEEKMVAELVPRLEYDALLQKLQKMKENEEKMIAELNEKKEKAKADREIAKVSFCFDDTMLPSLISL